MSQLNEKHKAILSAMPEERIEASRLRLSLPFELHLNRFKFYQAMNELEQAGMVRYFLKEARNGAAVVRERWYERIKL